MYVYGFMKQSNQPKGDTGLLLEPVFHGSIDLLNWMLCRFSGSSACFPWLKTMAPNHRSLPGKTGLRPFLSVKNIVFLYEMLMVCRTFRFFEAYQNNTTIFWVFSFWVVNPLDTRTRCGRNFCVAGFSKPTLWLASSVVSWVVLKKKQQVKLN